MKEIEGKKYTRKVALEAIPHQMRREGAYIHLAGLKHYKIVHIGITMAYLLRVHE